MSFCWPGPRMKRTGRPSASTTAWILVPKLDGSVHALRPGGRKLDERRFMRDLGTRGPTEGRIRMRIVHGGRRLGDAGLRMAATDRWLYVVSGVAGFSSDRALPVRLTPGDTLTTAAQDGNWRFHDMTEDFVVLEMRTGLP